MSRIIREAKSTDMAAIMQVMDAAKNIMRQSGNMHQWGDGYPSEAVISSDIEKNGGFVIVDGSKDNNIRIDTHRDNKIMRHNIEKHCFTYCGIIYLANGDERLAYQKQLEETV